VDQEAPQVDSGLIRRSGCIGFVAAIVDTSKSARYLQDANARVKAAVDEAGREEVAATTGGDSFLLSLRLGRSGSYLRVCHQLGEPGLVLQ
jgi:hypothetical protein